MEIRKVPISLLNAAPYNPRKDLQPGDPEYQKIARSIEKYGCVEPIIWNEKTGNVIGGHQRLKVLAATGAVEVDVSVVQLSLEDEKALNLALNKISGQWDNEKLSAVLQDLSAGFDVEVTGFDQHEVDALVASFAESGHEYELPGSEPYINNFFDSGVQAKPKAEEPAAVPAPEAPAQDAEMHPSAAPTPNNDLRCTCVELDCQKVLGVREAWYLRERMKKLLDNPQINVFHFEDGMRGLDSMIDFSDYIALSIPELRIIKPKTFREDTRYLTHYIKNRKPEIDIHLLGCTDVKMIAQNSFCTSADSTSWLSGVKYGWFDDGNQKAHINQFRKDLIEQRLSAVRTITEGRGLELTDKTLLYGARASLCATICKQKYTRAAGSQE